MGIASANTVCAMPQDPRTFVAQDLRHNLTDAERRLWARLRDSQIGVRFRRQEPIGDYIADFVARRARLVVELDGSQHTEDADAARTAYLESRGYRVLRFWNNEVLQNTDGVVLVIQAALRSPRASPPCPRPERGRERSRCEPLPLSGGGQGGDSLDGRGAAYAYLRDSAAIAARTAACGESIGAIRSMA